MSKRRMHSAGGHKAKGERRTLDVHQELGQAYRAVFTEQTATEQQKDMVLVDLAEFSGFYSITPGGSDPDTRAFNEGQRAVFGRVLRFLNMTAEERSFLEEETRHQTLISVAEGDLV